mgnify:CR=1 FL=1
MLLIIVSYRLWLPPSWTQTSYYPAIPFVALPAWLSDWVSLLLAPILVVMSTIVIVRRGAFSARVAWSCISLALAAGFLTDQHRLQPWAYQTFLYGWMFVLLPTNMRIDAFRILTISIYLFSSLGKFDYQFLHTVGQEFLATGAKFTHLTIDQWSDRRRLIVVAGFPATELLIAILLMLPPTRRLGGCLAIAMHAGLMVLLSPWGMHHSLGVLVWNAVLAGQAYWLFVRRPHSNTDTIEMEAAAYRSPGLVVGGMLVILAVTLPLTERRGRYDRDAWHLDHWLSWALYSPHNSRVDVEVYEGVVNSLPAAMQSAVSEDDDGDSWRKLDLGKLSLACRGVPILPQARYQLQLAIAMAEEFEWTHQIRGVSRSASDRRDGSRTEIWMSGLDEMKDAARGR